MAEISATHFEQDRFLACTRLGRCTAQLESLPTAQAAATTVLLLPLDCILGPFACIQRHDSENAVWRHSLALQDTTQKDAVRWHVLENNSTLCILI